MILFHYIILKCTVASKFLLLQESTRDPTDLYLSLRYPPLVFVCDTPCGVVRHMDCRNPEITKELWGNFAGCFEKPSFEKLPDQVKCNMLYRLHLYLWYILYLGNVDGTYWAIDSTRQPVRTNLLCVNSTRLIFVVRQTSMLQATRK